VIVAYVSGRAQSIDAAREATRSPSGESPARSGYFYPVNLELAAAAVAAPAAVTAVAAVI